MSTAQATSARSAVTTGRSKCEPRLAYEDEVAAVAFLTSAFGLVEAARIADSGASLMAWLTFGDSTIMVGGSGSGHHNVYSPKETGKPSAMVNLVIDEIDVHYQRGRRGGSHRDPTRRHALGHATIRNAGPRREPLARHARALKSPVASAGRPHARLDESS